LRFDFVLTEVIRNSIINTIIDIKAIKASAGLSASETVEKQYIINKMNNMNFIKTKNLF